MGWPRVPALASPDTILCLLLKLQDGLQSSTYVLSLKNVKYSRQKIVDMLIYYSELQQNDQPVFASMGPFI